MEENKNTNKMKKIIIIGISIICIILLLVGILIFKNIANIRAKEENRYVNMETTYFEEIGNYEIAYAGNNNSDRGTAIDKNVKLINSYPSNWNVIQSNIPNNILSRITNISGSRLDFDGVIKKAWISTVIFDGTESKSCSYDILVIKPDGSYEILYKKTLQSVAISITQSGWYYVSILDAPVSPHLAWAITAIYENNSLPKKYINISYVPYLIVGSDIIEVTDKENYRNIMNVNFSSAFSTAFNDKYGLYGIVTGGGDGGWANSGGTEDRLEVKLSDGTYKQLYSNTYNGKTIFAGRTTTDFFNDTFNTIRSHNIKGGEVDIFYENIGKDYFGNKDIIGYRVTKTGSNFFKTQLFGITRELAYPSMTINSEITNQTLNKLIENEKVHIKIDVTNNSVNENRPAYKSTITYKIDNALSNVENLVVKVDGVNSNLEPVYNSITNEITINNIEKITPGQIVTLEYDTTINSNIQNKGEINSNIELPIEVNVQSYPIDINALEVSEQEKYRELYVEEESTVNVSGIYKKASAGVEVKYIDEVTGEEIELAETKTGYYGEEYETEAKDIVGYEVVEIPTNKEGTMIEEKITVTYKYRKLSKVIVKYIDLNNGNEIDREEGTYKEGESYTTDEKEIEGYRLISVPGNKEGIVEREDIVVEYGYKKIVIGVEVKYIDEVTNEEIESMEIVTGIEGDNYTTNAKEILDYELVEEPINASGKMREDTITVTYKYRKLSKVIVRYVNKNSNEEFDRVEKIYKEGDNYTTEEKEVNNYKLVKTPVNANGVVGREDIEVVYEYRKIAGGIEVKYIDEVTNEEIVTSEHEVGLVGEEYLIIKKEIPGYELVEVPENEKGVMSEEKIIVIYKYRKLSKVIVMYIDKESGKEIERVEMEYKEGDSYKIDKKEIPGYKLIEKPKNEEGIVERKDIEVKYYYEKEKVLVKVEINIVDEKGNIIEVIEKEGYKGEVEEIELPEVDGYYTEEKSIVIEYGKENNVNIVYKKNIFDLPNTSDINIYLYVGIFIVSIIVISLLIINKVKKKK